MKKVQPILLLAINILVLVVTVLPHHHHGEVMAFFAERDCKIQLHNLAQHNDKSHSDDNCSQRDIFNLFKGSTTDSVSPDNVQDHPEASFVAILFQAASLAVLNESSSKPERYSSLQDDAIDDQAFGGSFSHRGPPSFIA